MNFSIEDLHASSFLSKQVRHSLLKEAPEGAFLINTADQMYSSSTSISRSIASRFRLNASQAFSDSFGQLSDGRYDSNFMTTGMENAKVTAEEGQGICAIIELVGYTDLIASLSESVPAVVIARSLESAVSKVCLFSGDSSR